MKRSRRTARLATAAALCAAIWAALFLLSAISWAPRGLPHFQAREVTMRSSAESKERVLAVVGVMTGRLDMQRVQDGGAKYDYVARRAALLRSWFPASEGQVARLRELGVVIKFVVPREHDPDVQELAKELPESVMVLDEVERCVAGARDN